MARHLYRLGGWAFDHRKRVLVVWLVALATVFGAAAAFSGKITSAFTVPGIPSQPALDQLGAKFPAAADGMARMVFAAPEGHAGDPASSAGIGRSVTARPVWSPTSSTPRAKTVSSRPSRSLMCTSRLAAAETRPRPNSRASPTRPGPPGCGSNSAAAAAATGPRPRPRGRRDGRHRRAGDHVRLARRRRAAAAHRADRRRHRRRRASRALQRHRDLLHRTDAGR